MNFALIITCNKEDLVDILRVLVELDIFDFKISNIEDASFNKINNYLVVINTRDIDLIALLAKELSNKL